MTRALLFALVLPIAADAAAPALSDFTAGFALQPQPGYAVQDLPLPDAVYAGITRADLGDLRVFNGGELVVPYALCVAPEPVQQVQERPLQVFALRRGQTAVVSGAQIDVRTAEGTQLHIAPTAPGSIATPSSAITAYVVDTGETSSDIDTLRLGWHAPDGGSEAHLRIESSADLDRWNPLIGATTLVHAQSAGSQLDRARVPLPAARYRYLRIESADGGVLPELGEVVGESHVQAAETEVVEFAAAPLPEAKAGDGTDGFRYDSQRLAPVRAASVVLPMNNMALVVALDSRTAPQQAWRTVWSGEITSIAGAGGVPASTVIRFEPQVARDWRLRVLRGADSLGGGRPELRLRYRPVHLRFLTQGDGPFLLAYGSGRVLADASLRCDQMTGAPAGADAASPTFGKATAERAPVARFGGGAALKPLPPPTPLRQIVLWAILIAGTLLLVWIALRLLRQLRAENSAGG
jgi:hypothetical protein